MNEERVMYVDKSFKYFVVPMLNMKVIKYKRSTIVSLVARLPFTKVKVKKKAKRKLEVQTNPRPIPLTTFTKVYKEGEIIISFIT
jgi:hypothetical protein